MSKLLKTIKDPGVLFSALHVSTFFVTAGAASPIFLIAMGSFGLSFGFSAIQNKLVPNDLKLPNGAALTTNGAILGGISALSALSGNIPSAIIGGLYAISNTSKGLEISQKPNLKSLGNKLFPKNTRQYQAIKNTVFSAEFIASAGAFSVGAYGIGAAAAVGMAVATGTLLTLGNSNNIIENPTWHKIPMAKAAFDQVANITKKVPSLKTSFSPETKVGDIAMSRYVMAGISISYGVGSWLSHKVGIGNEVLAVGHAFAAAANIRIGNFQRANDNSQMPLNPPLVKKL